ncbi:6-bladed beta-propeller protein [Tangfeifania diversioriginum]|uniref:6-bladed beta-propeller protein n=1 Tax=Tangfeifania diversioriginum TaxID=1168035 RepID=A0A1M6NUK0_9BACT|nr:6-bladed beta-propeller [Tangfeifania diversioriginum]SHJ99292.1 6-bladed beta-propeller protein [Tangfeifania diversioriginum]
MKKTLLLFVVVLVIGCNKNKMKDYCAVDLSQTLKYDISNYPNAKKLPVFGEQYFIPMETTSNPNNILGEVKKISASQKYIFLADDQKIICYGLDENLQKGTIKYTINNIGKGPEEYYKIEDFAINKRFLFIYDVHKVNCYDINSGEFISSINLNFAARELAALNDYLVFYASSFQNQPEYNYEIIVLSIDGKKEHKYFKNSEKYLGSVDGSQLCRIDNELFYCSPFRNIVYKFDEQASPRPFLLLSADAENKAFDLTVRDDINNRDDLKNGDYYYNFTSLQKLNEYWSIRYCHNGNYYTVYINIQNPDKGYIASTSFLSHTVYKNHLVSPVDSWSIAKFDPQLFKDDTTALKMYSRVLNVNENDNPCLLIEEIQ